VKKNPKFNDGRENKRSRRYCVSPISHAEFTRSIRRRIRAKAKNEIRNGREPEAKSALQYEYYD
jgi:hypothetical protein